MERGLPIELRLLIYKAVFTKDTGRQDVAFFKCSQRTSQQPTSPFLQKFIVSSNVSRFLGLRLVSKQVNLEATDIFYSHHQFKFLDIHTILSFLVQAQPQTLSRIRRISLVRWARNFKRLNFTFAPVLAWLRGATNLVEFQFPREINYFGVLVEEGDTLSREIGRCFAIFLYRFCHPILSPWMARLDGEELQVAVKQLGKSVKVADATFKTASSHLMTGLYPVAEDDKETRKAKKKTREERLKLARETMLSVLLKLHRDPRFYRELLENARSPTSDDALPFLVPYMSSG